MKVKNNSNYPKRLEKVWIQPGSVEELDLDEEIVRDHGYLEIVEEDEPAPKGESEDDTEETSKPQEKTENEGDE